MNRASWPTLTIYDFLGYFIPGALGVYLLLSLQSGSLGLSGGLPNLSWQAGLLFFLVAYVGGHLLSLLSALLIETYAVDIYGYPSTYLFRDAAPPKGLRASSLIVRLAILPIVLPSWLVGSVCGLSAKLVRRCDETVSVRIQAKIKSFLEVQELDGVEFFHLVAHWVREHAPGHASVLQAHVARKGFLRTLSLLFAIGVWAGLGMFIRSGQPNFLILSVLCLVAGYLAFLAYLKQERRFSLETLMAFTVAYGRDN